MLKRHKFTTEEAAIKVMSQLHSEGKINGWNITKAGYVRYFDVPAKVWRDLVEFDFDARRWGNKALVN